MHHNYSRNSHKESYGSNDMVHAYFLEDARKMTQDKTRIPNHRDMASTRAHCTPNACTPKLRNIYRSSPVSKCSGEMSRIYPKNRNNNPVEPKNHTHKLGRQKWVLGQGFLSIIFPAVLINHTLLDLNLRWKPTVEFSRLSVLGDTTGKGVQEFKNLMNMLQMMSVTISSRPVVLLHLDDSIKKSRIEKSPKEIIRIKREQGEEKQESTYSIRSTDKVALEEFDLKSALFKHMNKNKTANKNPANYHLYHALMEALIADEDAMDKEVAVKVKDHKRKHDSDDDEDDDDDEGPSAGSNQGRSAKRRRPNSAASGGKSTKRRRHDSDASGLAQPPTKDNEQFATESEQSEQSSDNIPMQDEGHVSDLEDTDNAHIPKANTYATTYQVPTENKLQRKTYDIGSFIKWFCRQTGKKKLCKADLEGPAFNLVKAFHKNNVFLQYQMDECHKLLTNKFLEWEADVDSEHFDRDDNTGDDNEETKPDPEEIYK
ncbi:hypothetical protein Tco_0932469 [Tanacetum coccineum]